jgi:hypothetical protein
MIGIQVKRTVNPLNRNSRFGKIPRRYLVPKTGNTTYSTRQEAMEVFLPEFKGFLLNAGISEEIQRSMGLQYSLAVDPRWGTSACDNISAKCTYLGMHFAVWSNGPKKDGTIELHLFGDLTSGKYRSGACTDPDEFGRKFALLVCEAERIKDLRWWRKIPDEVERICQCLITLAMCISFFIIPDNDWEKADYFAVFVGLSACALLSYISRVKEDDSLIDSQINQQAIAF